MQATQFEKTNADQSLEVFLKKPDPILCSKRWGRYAVNVCTAVTGVGGIVSTSSLLGYPAGVWKAGIPLTVCSGLATCLLFSKVRGNDRALKNVANFLDKEKSNCAGIVSAVRQFDNKNAVELIGEGGFGKVYSMPLREGGQVAIKEVKFESEYWLSRIAMTRHEADMLLEMKNPNMVSLFGAYQDSDRMILVMELCQGNLGDALRKKMSSPEKYKAAFDTAAGLSYVHEKGWVFRDISPKNILLNSKNTWVLCDPAYMCKPDHDDRKSGVYEYCAPEVMTKDKPFSVGSDSWALGIIFHLLGGVMNKDHSNYFYRTDENSKCVNNFKEAYNMHVDLDLKFMLHPIKDHKNIQYMDLVQDNAKPDVKVLKELCPEVKLICLGAPMLKEDPDKRLTPKEALPCMEQLWPTNCSQYQHKMLCRD